MPKLKASENNEFKIGEFKKNDKVLVYRKHEPSEWKTRWIGDMDAWVGKMAIIKEVSESFGYRLSGYGEDADMGVSIFWFPNTCLKRMEEAIMETKPKKRRVRVGPGPWDAAPCPHLRWNLMGFFREKLALVKTKVRMDDTSGNPVEVEVKQVEIACAKCGTKMTLQAK